MDDRNVIYSQQVEWLGKNHTNQSGKSDKFYRVEVYPSGNSWAEERRWGKYGTKGQTKIIAHPYEAWALDSAESQIANKLRSGYTRPIDPLTRLATALDN